MQRPADFVMPTYAPPAPTAAYEGSDQAAIMQQMIADYVNRTDPRMQAEQDARMQRGRQFWTGANLFANVIANAINASGTAKGAPSMTWNDNASQKMYDTWQNADKELKADRKAAQQRLDALRLQDAQFRMAEAQARDKAALDAYKINYQNQEAANQAKHAAEVKEFEYQRGKQDAAEKTAAENAEWNRRQSVQNYYDKLKNERSIELKQAAKGYNEKQRTQIIGGTEFEATSEARAQGLVAQVYSQMLKRLNTDENGKKAAGTAKDPNDFFKN